MSYWRLLCPTGKFIKHITMQADIPSHEQVIRALARQEFIRPCPDFYETNVYGQRISVVHPEYGELYVLEKAG